mmetsp:Transcript_15232/g.32768  ORF Transcript_15232/g.32768 Transcript_15232/m.32768 type:complete len:204 (-) Transcript_15232:149-760(-)
MQRNATQRNSIQPILPVSRPLLVPPCLRPRPLPRFCFPLPFSPSSRPCRRRVSLRRSSCPCSWPSSRPCWHRVARRSWVPSFPACCLFCCRCDGRLVSPFWRFRSTTGCFAGCFSWREFRAWRRRCCCCCCCCCCRHGPDPFSQRCVPGRFLSYCCCCCCCCRPCSCWRRWTFLLFLSCCRFLPLWMDSWMDGWVVAVLYSKL